MVSLTAKLYLSSTRLEKFTGIQTRPLCHGAARYGAISKASNASSGFLCGNRSAFAQNLPPVSAPTSTNHCVIPRGTTLFSDPRSIPHQLFAFQLV